jgi:hypothetical protein
LAGKRRKGKIKGKNLQCTGVTNLAKIKAKYGLEE